MFADKQTQLQRNTGDQQQYLTTGNNKQRDSNTITTADDWLEWVGELCRGLLQCVDRRIEMVPELFHRHVNVTDGFLLHRSQLLPQLSQPRHDTNKQTNKHRNDTAHQTVIHHQQVGDIRLQATLSSNSVTELFKLCYL